MENSKTRNLNIKNAQSRKSITAELEDIVQMVDKASQKLPPAIYEFSEIYNEQEMKKLNIMKIASTVSVEGEKMKNTDFIMAFDETLADAVRQVVETAKNSVRMSLYLNAANDGLEGISEAFKENIPGRPRPSDIAAFVSQISLDLKTCQEILHTLATLDVEGSMRAQERLQALLEGFTQRNLQLKESIGNPPMSSKRMEDALSNIISEIKNSQLVKYKLEKLIAAINGSQTGE